MDEKDILGFAPEENVSIAKIAAKYGWNGSKLNSLLHDFFIIRHKINSANDWCLVDGYDGRGYAVMASFVGSEDGKEHEYMLWTLKGRNLIYNLLKYEIGIIPESATIYKEKTKKKTKKKGGNK